jgi:hypothetical protein
MVEEARQSSILSQGRSGDRAYMGRHELARYLAGDVTETGQEIPLPQNQRKGCTHFHLSLPSLHSNRLTNIR